MDNGNSNAVALFDAVPALFMLLVAETLLARTAFDGLDFAGDVPLVSKPVFVKDPVTCSWVGSNWL